MRKFLVRHRVALLATTFVVLGSTGLLVASAAPSIPPTPVADVSGVHGPGLVTIEGHTGGANELPPVAVAPALVPVVEPAPVVTAAKPTPKVTAKPVAKGESDFARNVRLCMAGGIKRSSCEAHAKPGVGGDPDCSDFVTLPDWCKGPSQSVIDKENKFVAACEKKGGWVNHDGTHCVTPTKAAPKPTPTKPKPIDCEYPYVRNSKGVCVPPEPKDEKPVPCNSTNGKPCEADGTWEDN